MYLFAVFMTEQFFVELNIMVQKSDSNVFEANDAIIGYPFKTKYNCIMKVIIASKSD